MSFDEPRTWLLREGGVQSPAMFPFPFDRRISRNHLVYRKISRFFKVIACSAAGPTNR